MSVKEALYSLSEMNMSDPTPLCYARGTTTRILEWFAPFVDAILARVSELVKNKVVLLTVCSNGKPYSQSWIHYEINVALYDAKLLDRVSIWHLSSAGVIPSELEEEYPFCSYDWNNANATDLQLEALRKTLSDYFERFLLQFVVPYKRKLVTYFREDSNTQRVIDKVLERSHPFIEVLSCVRVKPCWLDQEERRLTLGGKYTDPDNVLLSSRNIALLQDALERVVGGGAK